MVDKRLVKQLREAYNSNRKIVRGVYLVNDNVVAKSREPGPVEERTLFAERAIGEFLYDNGVSVPKMYGIVKPDFIEMLHRSPLDKFFLLMERVHGVTPNKLEDGLLEEAGRQYKAELLKVLELGIYPTDVFHPSNAVFDTNKQRIFLIDFEGWDERRPEEAFQSLYQRISTAQSPFSRSRVHPANP